jgi:hypothetical protein
MQKLNAVEEAKTLLSEAAKDWSVWRWLMEKKRVRRTADLAWEALEEVEKKVKGSWGDDLRKAYRELQAAAALDSNPRARRQYEKTKEEAKDVDADLKLFAERLKEADDEAFQARMTAEETFDEAERRLSIPMARQGSEQAIEAYELREKFIRRAEAAARRKSSA